MGLTKTQSGGLEDQSVTLDKLPHGDGSSDGKFLRANNGADPSFETVSTDLVGDTSPQLGGTLDCNGQDVQFKSGGGNVKVLFDASDDSFEFADSAKAKFGAGDDLQIYHDGTDTHIDNATSNLRIKSNDIQFRDTAENFYVDCNNGGSVDLYHNGTKQCETSANGLAFPSGKGIDFSATSGSGTSELLDDYEEGTWTPTWSPASGSINTLTAWGNYVKIGRVVHCMFAISANGSSGESGRLDVGGLPFTADIPSANGIRGGGGVAFPGAAQNQDITKVVANGSDLYVLLANNSFLQTNSSGISYSYNAAQLSGMFTYLTS